MGREGEELGYEIEEQARTHSWGQGLKGNLTLEFKLHLKIFILTSLSGKPEHFSPIRVGPDINSMVQDTVWQQLHKRFWGHSLHWQVLNQENSGRLPSSGHCSNSLLHSGKAPSASLYRSCKGLLIAVLEGDRWASFPAPKAFAERKRQECSEETSWSSQLESWGTPEAQNT